MNHPIFRLLYGLLLVTGLALSGCGAHRKLATGVPPQSQPIAQTGTAGATPLAGVFVQPNRSLLDKLTGYTPPPVCYPPGTPVIAGKKSTTTVNNNYVAGNQHNQTNTAGKNAAAGAGATTGGKADGPVAGTGGTLTNIEKAKAPVSTGTGDATDQSGTGVGSTIKGNNNAPVLTNTEQKALDWKAQLASGLSTPVGKALAALLLASVGYGVYRLWPVLRRKSSTNTTA